MHAGGYVIGACVHVYMYVGIYVCDPKKFEWHFRGVDSPFETLTIDFSSNL